MSLTVLTNAFLIDCTGREPVEGAALVVEDERIKDVLSNGRVGPLPGPVTTLDCRGATLMPGLTDAHVHFCAVTENVLEQHRQYPPSYIAARAMRRAEECLLQGFTTVRDAGGSDYGVRLLLEEGHFPGPRVLVSGNFISQTGGHGDLRRRAEWIAPVDCCVGMMASIADGEAEVRRAVREQLRHGVDQIKVMASGGAMSPGDETRHHAVLRRRAPGRRGGSPGRRHLRAGPRLLRQRSAASGGGGRALHRARQPDRRRSASQAIKDAGAFLVPTMVTYEAIYREASATGSAITRSRRSPWPVSRACRA